MKSSQTTAFFLFNIVIGFLITILITTLTTNEAFARTTYTNLYTSNPASYASRDECPDTSGCDDSFPVCYNSASVGRTDCGTACDGGSPWARLHIVISVS